HTPRGVRYKDPRFSLRWRGGRPTWWPCGDCAHECGNLLRTGKRTRLFIFSQVGPIKQIDRMDNLDRAAPFLDLASDLEDAADIAGGDDRGTGGFDVIHLPPAQALGHLGLGQVVRTRGAAAKLAFLEWYELEAGDHRQKLPGLAANLLRMAEVASVVIGHFQRHRVLGRDRPEGDEELGDVLDL